MINLCRIFFLISVAAFVHAGPVRNDTRQYASFPYNLVMQPASLLIPRIPQSSKLRVKSNNFQLIIPRVNPLDQDNEDHEEYDLYEQKDGQGNSPILSKIKDPRRYFVSENEDPVVEEDEEEEFLEYCADGNIEYSVGETYVHSSSPCETCTCTQTGPKCSSIICLPPRDGCIEAMMRPGDCCPTCTRHGCRHGENVYEIGEIFNITDCDLCLCTEEGQTDCSIADCAPPLCVDAVHIEGECCPVCQNGPNCYASGGEIIPAGEWVSVNALDCMICKCKPTFEGSNYWYGHRQAKCKIDDGCHQ